MAADPANALAGLPPWLQALATITAATVIGVPSLLAYLKPKPVIATDAPVGTGALVAQAFASQNDISKTLESMKRIEAFSEQLLEVSERIETNQRAGIERWHSVDMALLGIKGTLERICDNLRR